MEILIRIAGKDIIIPDTIINVWLVVVLLIVFALITSRKIKNEGTDRAPSNFLNIVELLIEATEGLVRATMGSQNMGFLPYFLTIILFLLVANLLGLLGLSPPTSDYSVTLSLALITFFLTQYWKVRNSGGILGYLKGFGEPIIFLAPLNIIGELANPISLSFRLFGNIMSGGIIIALIYQGVGFIAPVITAPLHAYFDVFSGVLQTFIFVILSIIFIGGKE